MLTITNFLILFNEDGSDENLCPYTFTFEECLEQTGEELCLWQNEAPDKLIWKVIASKTSLPLRVKR